MKESLTGNKEPAVIRLFLIAVVVAVNSVNIQDSAFSEEEELPVEMQADIVMESAEVNIAGERWEDAIKDFEKLVEMNLEDQEQIFFKYGMVLLKAGNYIEAIVKLKKCLKLTGKEGVYYKEALDLIVEAENNQAVMEQLLMEFENGMVLIKGGCFDMGDVFGDGLDSEKPVHEVCVDDFYIGKYEVTQRLWEEVMGNNPSVFKNGDNYPVENVSWYDVQEFIRKLNKKADKNYRIPTEAEWEYAARSRGKKYKYSWGNGNPEGNVAGEEVARRYPKRFWKIWDEYNDGYVNTAPVGSFGANELGLYDMTGNVWELCSDWFDENYYKNSPRKNPKGPSRGSELVIRGGDAQNEPSKVRVSVRSFTTPTRRYGGMGFRLARTP